MEIEKALKIYEQLIEQAMAAGFFKKFEQIDTVRSSYNSIKEHLKNCNDGKSNKESGKENTGEENRG